MDGLIVAGLVSLFIVALLGLCGSSSFGDNDLDRDARDATYLTPWSARIKAKRLLEKLEAE